MTKTTLGSSVMAGIRVYLCTLLATLTLSVVTHPGYAQDAPDCKQQIAEAENHYYNADFEKVFDLLNACLDLADSDLSARAYRLISLTYIGLDDLQKAKKATRQFLELAPGYEPDLMRDRPEFIAFIGELTKIGTLILISEPPNAQITIADTLSSVTPDTLELKPGIYEIRLEHLGYYPDTMTVDIIGGYSQIETIKLDPINTHYLVIDTTPDSADVTINGQHAGTTLFSQNLPARVYEIRISKDEYLDQLLSVDLSSENQTLRLVLEAENPIEQGMPPDFYLNRAADLFSETEYQKARMYYEKVLELTPDNTLAQDQLIKIDLFERLLVLRVSAEAYMKNEEYESAKPLVEDILKATPSDNQARAWYETILNQTTVFKNMPVITLAAGKYAYSGARESLSDYSGSNIALRYWAVSPDDLSMGGFALSYTGSRQLVPSQEDSTFIYEQSSLIDADVRAGFYAYKSEWAMLGLYIGAGGSALNLTSEDRKFFFSGPVGGVIQVFPLRSQQLPLPRFGIELAFSYRWAAVLPSSSSDNEFQVVLPRTVFSLGLNMRL